MSLSTDPLAVYLRDIRRTPLLTAVEEVTLARRIEAGLLATRRLEAVAGLPVDVRDELARVVDAGRAAKALLVEANLRLVVMLARPYASSSAALLDLIQEGNIGLLRAADKFDYRRGNKFSTYASWWIRQAVARGYCEHGRTIRIPVHVVEAMHRLRKQQRVLAQQLGRRPSVSELAGAVGTTTAKVLDLLRWSDEPRSLDVRVGPDDDGSLAELIADESAASPVNEVAARAVRREVERLLESVDARDRLVLTLRYGLTGERPHTLEEVGDRLGVTRERVRQLEARALLRIREAHDVEDFRGFLSA